MNRTLRFILLQTIPEVHCLQTVPHSPLGLQNLNPSRKVQTTMYIYKLTFRSHAHGQALLESTVLTPISVGFVDRTVFVSAARVPQLFPDAPFEEPLTPFTTCAAIMTTYGSKGKSTSMVPGTEDFA